MDLALADAVTVVTAALEQLSHAVATRDLDTTVASFSSQPDVVLVGSESGYAARGTAELAATFRNIYARPKTFSWEWHEPVVGLSGSLVWFYVEGDELVDDEASTERLPYRASGVLRLEDDSWRWVLFHGSEPA